MQEKMGYPMSKFEFGLVANFNSVISLIDAMSKGPSLPMPLEHLQYHPELMDDEMREKMNEINIATVCCLESMPPGLVGLGEIMQMTEADNEMESINFDDMVARIKRVGYVVETFASLISYCHAAQRASEYAIENFNSYQEGRYARRICSFCNEPCGNPEPEAA